VSHDRYFISKLATAMLVIDGGKATYYPLTYSEYMNKEPISILPKVEVISEKVKPERYINYGKEISKLEKKIASKEEELESLRELRYDPTYYHDYQKMNTLDSQIDDVHNEIESMMKTWEEYSEKTEQ
ncbi:MAG: ABC transporter ATP-binding protein, partial [Longicatena sp.]